MKPIAVTLAAGRRDFFWLGATGMFTVSPVRGPGFNLNLGGGRFASAPAAVASLARQKPSLSTDGTAVSGQLLAGGAEGSETAASETEAEFAMASSGATGLAHESVLGAMTHRLDLFGLGANYAMLHKRIWGAIDQHDLASWLDLGGIFTSAPSAVAWPNGRVDVFGLGLDHALYTKQHAGTWSSNWRRLGGAFSSAASLVFRGGSRLDVFVRGADYTLRRNRTDGADWFGWQNLGGNLASPPAAVSWGPDRLDIFAVFKDRALWHRWWDGDFWSDWESLGGQYASEPAVVSWAPGRFDVFVEGAADGLCHHLWFSNDGWSPPETFNFHTHHAMTEAATAISAAPNHLEVFVPTANREIRVGEWDGQAWQFAATGASLRIPSRYRFSVDRVKVHTTRALNADTDAAVAMLTAGNAPPIIRTQWIGKIGGATNPKVSQTNLLDFDGVTIDLAEPMSFGYIVVNNGHASQDKILAALASGANSLSLAASASMAEEIGKGVAKWVAVKLVSALSLSIPVLGSILSSIESWLLDKLTDAIFKSCDGIVAAELRAITGRELHILTDNGAKTVNGSTRHAGTASPGACGDESDYEIFWSIVPQP